MHVLQFWWPIALIVFSNTLYHVCAKSSPNQLNPFAGLTITYIVGAVASAIIYFIFNPHSNILSEYRYVNWTTIVFGFILVGLEVGCIYMYKAGWQMSLGNMVTSVIVAIILIFVGRIFYSEAITWTKVAGIALCLAGLFLINK